MSYLNQLNNFEQVEQFGTLALDFNLNLMDSDSCILTNKVF